LTDSLQTYSLNLSAAVNDVNGTDIGSLLRVPKLSGGNNADNIFNNGAAVQVKIRPVVHTAVAATWDGSEKAGVWSAAIGFKDTLAPCDTDFVANDGNLGNLNDNTKGGVKVVVTACATDRSALTTDGDYVIELTFPEDMDTTMRPTLTTYYGGVATAPATGISVNSVKSYWNNNRYTYRMTVNLPANADWSAAGASKPYFGISVVGMKDVSSQAIQDWGSVGDAGINKLLGAVTGEKKGTRNLNGLTAY
jgi:hypothetical protein